MANFTGTVMVDVTNPYAPFFAVVAVLFLAGLGGLYYSLSLWGRNPKKAAFTSLLVGLSVVVLSLMAQTFFATITIVDLAQDVLQPQVIENPYVNWLYLPVVLGFVNLVLCALTLLLYATKSTIEVFE